MSRLDDDTSNSTTARQSKKLQKQEEETNTEEDYDEHQHKSKRFQSSVKTYKPPDGSPAVICIHTRPRLMKRLANFLQHFDRPPQQLFLEFTFVEVEEQNVAQFRYKLTHPILDAVYNGSSAMANFSLSPEELDAGSRRRLPGDLTPRM